MAFAEDPDSVVNPHIRWLTTKLVDSNVICDGKRRLYTISTHKPTQAHTQINKDTHT